MYILTSQKTLSIAIQDRPAFKALKDFMSEVIPPEMKSTKNFAAEGKLSVNEGDVIIILSGKAEHHWWKGQNKTTCQVGEFPRNIVCSSRPICGDDIRWDGRFFILYSVGTLCQ